MNKLTALIEAAKVATPGPWMWPDVGSSDFVISGPDRLAIGHLDSPRTAEFVALANPAAILELCALLEKAEKALEKERVSHITTGHTLGAKCQELYLLLMQAQTALEIINRTISCNYAGVPEALAAIKQWKEQT